MVTGNVETAQEEERAKKRLMLLNLITKITNFRTKNKSDVKKAVHKQLV